jgi:hypothetical protein
MRLLKRVAFAFLAILAVLLAVGFFLPRKVRVERSTAIAAPADVVFAHVNELHRWEAWTPWGTDRDPTVKLTYGGPTAGPGAYFTWASEQLGAGKLEIVGNQPPRAINLRLSFDDDMREPADVAFVFAPDGDRTNVTWSFDADTGNWPPGRYFGLFMDRFIGGDYERGLARLKAVVENSRGDAP